MPIPWDFDFESQPSTPRHLLPQPILGSSTRIPATAPDLKGMAKTGYRSWRGRAEHAVLLHDAAPPISPFFRRDKVGRCPYFRSRVLHAWLVVGAEEVVVSRVALELSLTHAAGGGWNSSAGSVQTLDEGGLEQEVTARGPSFVPD